MKAVIFASTILATLACQAAASVRISYHGSNLYLHLDVFGGGGGIVASGYNEEYSSLYSWNIVQSEDPTEGFTIQSSVNGEYIAATGWEDPCILRDAGTPFQNETVLEEDGKTYSAIQMVSIPTLALEIDDKLMVKQRDDNDRQLFTFEEIQE